MTERTASCSCGQLRITTRTEPLRVSICHCLACQRRTGSTFGAQARFDKDDVSVVGRSREYVRVGDEGGTITFHFCPECGSTVYYYLDSLPDHVAVPVGGFADPGFPSPGISIYEARRHRWLALPEDMEHHD